jgi:enolase-phosphatase E1
MIKAVVTDIEGTTTSLSFVKDVLFPYARNKMPDFLQEHWQDESVQGLVRDIQTETGREMTRHDVVQILQQWIDEDRKITPLKALQGLMWQAGYERGDFKGHVYQDAVDKLRQWHEQGIRLYVYSSGSIRAQKLLYGYTEHGDLTSLFDGYFDTTIGSKRDMDSYQRIAEELELDPAEILYLSDMPYELEAARSAGMRVVMLRREGQDNSGFDYVTDFSMIQLGVAD